MKAADLEPVKPPAITSAPFVRPTPPIGREIVTCDSIGHSANGYSYGYGGGQKTIVWVDNALNTFVNLHREVGGSPNYSGNLDIDISYDRGENFLVDQRIYTATVPGGTYYLDAARYPQGAIYNPPGNTDPANAYYAYFAPNLDGSNQAAGWGGYSFGVSNLVDFTDTTKHLRSSDPTDGLYQDVPDGYAMTKQGVSLVVDRLVDWSSTGVYLGANLVSRGVWNTASNDFEYDWFTLDAPVPPDSLFCPADHRCAFAPDGQTGYIVIITDDLSVEFSYRDFYPVIYKTTDGGENWEDPIGVQLGGDDGIPEIVDEFLSDDEINALWTVPPAREDIHYTTAFDCDIVVDASGNPHIAVVVGMSNYYHGDGAPYAIISGFNPPYDTIFVLSAYDIYSPDGGQTWRAFWCGDIKMLRGEYPDGQQDYTEDSRPQASITEDGTKVFISWLDTRYDQALSNNYPDIYSRGIDIGNYKMTEAPVNVTEYSLAWLAANFFCAPYNVFEDNGTYTIPFTYEHLIGNDAAQPVTYWYIKDFSYIDDDFTKVIPGGLMADAGSNGVMCEGGSYSLTGSAIGYDYLEWTTSGDGTFDDPTILEPFYTPGPDDNATGSVILILTAYKNSGESASDDMILTIKPAPVADAGDPGEICAGQSYTNTTATAEHYSSLLWSTSGDGTFDDGTILLPTYTPGANDITNGTVTLTLKAQGVFPCGFVTSGMILTILPLPGIPGIPAGPDFVDPTITPTSEYTIAEVPNATSYTWDLQPAEAGSISGTSATATVTWNEYTGLAYVKVKGVNSCGESDFSEPVIITVWTEGIDELNASRITITPNPNTGEFILNLVSRENALMQVRIMDAMGNVIYNENNIPVLQTLVKKITLSSIREGVYLMLINDGKTTVAKKFVIQK
ncbi:MAG: T9SS type A sorting domain-containing protein [Bacteroidetes bacterium]|nr:T9SS type A sorting domain-containing protein [Bacteroidota bacterium]